MEDYYYTIEQAIRAPELKVKGSRFIADLIPVRTKEEIEEALRHLRKEYYDATHHCFAYRLGKGGLLVRAADDGEPSGTAGKPILLVLTSQKLVNVLLIVTRYYGGTKLGTGGLARAYAESAQQAVSLAKIVRVYQTEHLHLRVMYEDLAPLEQVLHSMEAEIANSTYLDSVSLEVNVRHSKVEALLHAITDGFRGRVEVDRR